MAQHYEGQEVHVGVGMEATFLTRLLDAGTYTEIKSDPVELDPNVKVYEVPGASGSKSPLYDMTFTNTSGSTPRMKIAGPASIFELDLFAVCAFQDVLDEVATPFSKVLTPFAGIQPDFTTATLNTNAFCMTAIKAYPVADTSWAMTSCIAESFKLSAERDSYLKMEAGLVSCQPVEMDSDAHADGTFTRNTNSADDYGMKFFHDLATATLSFNGGAAQDLPIQSFSVEYTQEVSGEEPDGSGGLGNYGIIKRGGTGEVVLLKSAAAELALANWAANGYIELVLLWGTDGTVDNDLKIEAWGKITNIKFDESGIIAGTISFDLKAASTSTHMIRITVANAIDRSWPTT